MGLEGACRGLVCLPMTILTPVTSVNCLPLELNSFDKHTVVTICTKSFQLVKIDTLEVQILSSNCNKFISIANWNENKGMK